MAPAMWLFLGLTGWLTADLSGLQPLATPTPGQPNASSAESQALESGSLLRVRLVNASSYCHGEVEVRHGATWVPVCGAQWDHQAAEAVCQALGCGEAGSTPTPEPWTPAGNTSAANVTRRPALAVRCQGPKLGLCKLVDGLCGVDVAPARVTCAEARALRLVGGGGRCAGRVELLERGAWGSVCDDAWDLRDARVACRQLGCGWAVEAAPGLRFPAGRGLIHRDEVACEGNETHLWDCAGRPGDGYCGHKEDAGVVCSEHQSWRLTGGGDRCEGQVEVHFRGVWSTVCDSEWYQSEADVLCRALGCGLAMVRPPGRPHSLPGRMFYSCSGEEATPFLCTWRFNNSNLCRQSRAARVLCSGSRTPHNLSSSQVPPSVHPVTVEPPGTVKMEEKESRELTLLISSIVLSILLLTTLVSMAITLLRVKGKYALPVTGSHPHLLPTAIPAGSNSYHTVPVTIPKEEALQPPAQGRASPPEDSDSSSDSDYEHYDFSAQPPMVLTTFYNSQRHRVTEEEAQQSRFQMPPLVEGLEEPHASPMPSAMPGPCAADGRPGDPQCHPHSDSGSTSSGEDYCNSPGSKPPPWIPHVFSLEQPPSLELAGSQAPFPGPPADDSSSTSSGEWYQNFQAPPHLPSTEQFECPGHSGPQQDSSSEDTYDDIGAA